MHTPTRSALRRCCRFSTLCVALALLAPALFAQSTAAAPAEGTISGLLINRFTGEVLAGARVRLEGTNQQVVTDELGRFQLTNVPSGTQNLTSTYTGLQTDSETVEVKPGETTIVRIELDSEVVELAEFTVVSEREGNAAAIQSQKNAQNVKNVLALDALGILPNDNAGELLVRMPGVAPRLDEEGSVTGVSIRGFQPGSNNVAIDGDKMSSSGGLNRDFRMNSISGALFEEIEVTKAQTPDMDAEGLGGAVNFKSRSPLRMKEDHRFDFRVSGKWTPDFVDRTPMAEKHPLHPLLNLGYQGVYSVLGGHRNLGVSLKGFYSENANSAYSIQNLYSYASSTSSNPGLADYNRPFYWQNTYPYEVRMRDLYNNRVQTSANLRLEFKVSDDTRFWLTGIVNDAIENGQYIYQQRFFFSRQTETYNPDGTILSYGTRLANGVPFSPSFVQLRSGGRSQLNSTINTFDQRDRRLQFGGEHRAGDLMITGGLNISQTKVSMDDTPETGTGSAYTELKTAGSTSSTTGTAFTYDGTVDPTMPTITQTQGASMLDLVNYGGASGSSNSNLDSRLHYRSRQRVRDTKIASGNLDLARSLDTTVPVQLKAGVNIRKQQVDAIFNERDYYYTKTDVTKFQDVGRQTYWGTQRQQYPMLSVPLVAADILANPADWGTDLDYNYDATYNGTKIVKERVDAGYLQATFVFGKLQALGGVRVERTRTNAFGYEQDVLVSDLSYSTNLAALEAKYNRPTRYTRSYTDYFPGVHLKYEPLDRLIFRASYSTSMGRPNLTDIAPGRDSGASSDGSYFSFISLNNPNLKAQYSRNYDFTAEYYFKPYGVFSAGVFRKEISDFIYTLDLGDAADAVELLGEDFSFLIGTDYQGFQVRTKRNGGLATVEGFELGYQHQLTFLPGILRGLSLYANYTQLETEGDYDDGQNGEVADFVPRSGNAGFKFRYRKFTVDVAANYNSDYLDTYSSDPMRRIYRSSRWVANSTVSYAFQRYATVFVSFNNALNQPQEWFRKGAEGERFDRHVYNAMSVTFGVSGRF